MKRYKFYCGVICCGFLAYFLYDLSLSYLSYDTITNYHMNGLDNVSYFLVVESKCDNMNTERVNDIVNHILLNRKPLKATTIRGSAMRTILNIDYKHSPLEDLNFTYVNHMTNSCFEIRVTLVQSFYDKKAVVDIKLTRKLQIEYVYSPIAQPYQLQLLEKPYDNNCVNYMLPSDMTILLTRDEYRLACFELDDQENMTRCLSGTNNPSCIELNYYKILTPAVWIDKYNMMNPNLLGIYIVNQLGMSITATAYLPLSLFIFCAIGLIGTFLEFSVYDFSSMAHRKLFNFVIKIKSNPDDIDGSIFHHFNIIVRIVYIGLIYSMLVVHVFNATNNYLQYCHTTSTYFGQAVSVPSPSLVVCIPKENIRLEFGHSNLSGVINDMFDVIEIPISNFKPRLENFDWLDNNCIKVNPKDTIILKGKADAPIFNLIASKTIDKNILNQSVVFLTAQQDKYVSYHDWNDGILCEMSIGRNILANVIKRDILGSPYESKCSYYSKSKCIYECSLYSKYQECKKICHQRECKNTYWYMEAYTKDNTKRFQIQKPNTVTDIRHYPETNLPNLFLFIFSIISFWSGISITTSIFEIIRKIIKKFNYIVLAFITACFIYHIFLSVHIYLKYTTVTKVSFETSQYRLPYITFLIVKQVDKSWTAARRYEIFKNSMPIIRNLSIIDPEESKMIQIPDHILDQHISFWMQGTICYMTLDLSKLSTSAINNIDGRKYLPTIQFNISNNINEDIMYMIHNSRELGLSYSRGSKIMFEDMNRMQLLPSPYETDCEEEFEDLYRCYERKLKEQNESCSYLCMLPSTNNETISIPNKKHSDIVYECIRRKRPLICLTYSYHYSKGVYLKHITDYTDLNIHLYTKSNCEVFAQITFSTFMIIIADIVDLWFGVNLFWFTIWSTRKLRRKYVRLQNKRYRKKFNIRVIQVTPLQASNLSES